MPWPSGYGEARYNDLLQPCSDINKNWSINITDILKSYLDELTNVNIEVKDRENTLNFAEAALLIQGSASIFGKKVEYLYNLTNVLLQQLHTEKKKSSDGEKETRNKKKDLLLLGRNVGEFVPLDDITPGNNLNINEEAQLSKDNQVHKVPIAPLALIPLDTTEKGNVMLLNTRGEDLGNKRDYQMNICNMHSSGCLLLPTTNYNFSITEETCEPHIPDDESDTNEMIEDHDFDDSPGDEEEMNSETPLQDESPIIQPLDMLESGNDLLLMTDEAMSEPNSRRRSTRQADKLKALKEQEEKRKEKEEKELLESREAWKVKTQQLPEFKRQVQKKNIRKLPKKLLKKMQHPEEEEEMKDISALSFCSKNFFGAETDGLKKVGLVSHRMAINPAFEHLIIGCLKEQQEKLKTCRKRLSLEDVDVKDELAEAMEDFNEELNGDILPDAPVNNDDDDTVDNAPLCDDIDIPLTDNALSLPSSSEPQLYEERAKQLLESYMKEVANFCQTTELSQKVSKWEERIKPILEKENERETFSIHLYGTRIIDQFGNNNRKQQLPFSRICKDKQPWEVCRYFLASLQLANNSNVEIGTTKMEDGMDDVELILLSRKRHQEQLDNFGNSQGEH